MAASPSPTLLVTRGLPASGKSTYARTWVAQEPDRRVRVNRDDVRLMLYGTARDLSSRQEDQVTRIEQAMVRETLQRRADVIVDALHLREKDIRAWALLAHRFDARMHVIDFPVDVETAVLRDTARDGAVGERVIRDLARRFTDSGVPRPFDPTVLGIPMGPLFARYEPNRELAEAVVVDIDGTLAHVNPGSPRSPYDMSRVGEDMVDPNVRDTLIALSTALFDIVLVSGRHEVSRADTERWLRANGVPYVALFMRPDGDFRPDDVVKHEILVRDLTPRWHVRWAIDDRERVVAMWRSAGIACFQVAYGDF